MSPIGLGHAARSLEVAKRLAAMGVDLRVFSGGRAAEFMRNRGMDVDAVVSDATPSIVGGVMRGASLWYLRSWLALRRTVPRTRRLLGEFKPGLVVCDEEFSGMVAAEAAGVRRVLISDELELGFARSWLAKKVEGRVYRWYVRVQDGAEAVVIPEEGKDAGNRRYVGPIVRPVTAGKDEVLRSFGLPREGMLVLLSLSGSGQGSFLIPPVLSAFREASIPGGFLVVTGNRGRKAEGEGVYDLGVVGENQNLVAAADLVVSTAGKSTIDEAAAAGTPIIAVPIRHHAEQERNAAAEGGPPDLRGLAALMRDKAGRRRQPARCDGAETAARLISSMAAGA